MTTGKTGGMHQAYKAIMLAAPQGAPNFFTTAYIAHYSLPLKEKAVMCKAESFLEPRA